MSDFIGPCSCPCKKCIKRGEHNPFKCPRNCEANPETIEMILETLRENQIIKL